MESNQPLILSNLRLTVDSDNIATVLLDTAGKSVNSLSPAVLADLGMALDRIETTKPRGVIFASGKARSFIAGADLFEIRKMAREQIAQFLEDGQSLFRRIAELPMPTVAAINGDCLGGGLELALACKSRVAAAQGTISIGLPEVKLGILPAWGGTVRLPRLIGLANALPLMLAGKTLAPKKALKAGIIDEVVRPDALLAAARRQCTLAARPQQPSAIQRIATQIPSLRNRILAMAEQKTRQTARNNYPAPLRLLDVVRTSYEHGAAAGFEAERTALLELLNTDAAQNLVRLFFLRQGAKRAVFDPLSAKPADVNYAAVIGGGTMGAGIVHGLIRAGIQVRLVEVDPKAVSGALGRVQKMLDDDVAQGRLSTLEARHAANRVAPTCQWTGLGLADVAIEAVAEQMDVKQSVFARLDQLTRPDAVLASNTSSLRTAQIAEATRDPSRVVGLHFFNPVPKMPLVEVVRTPSSSDRALATAASLGMRMGKTPVLVADAPGFLVNRVLIPYLAEAVRVATEGTPITQIDTAMKDWGMPMGPFELLDEIGLDIALHVLRSTGDASAAPPGLEQAINRGWLGKKSGRGFYIHQQKKRRDEALEANAEMTPLLITTGTAPKSMTPEQTQWRLILPMVNETARLLDEGVTDSTDAVDLATVLGLGFAPFRGGLAHLADDVGLGPIVQRLEALAAEHGPRFAPAPLLRRLAEEHRPLSQLRELKMSQPAPSSPAHA